MELPRTLVVGQSSLERHRTMLKYAVILILLSGCAGEKKTTAKSYGTSNYELAKKLFDENKGLDNGFNWKPKVRKLIGEPDIIEEVPSSLIIFREIYIVDEESYFYIEGERHLQNRARLSDVKHDLSDREFVHYKVYGDKEW